MNDSGGGGVSALTPGCPENTVPAPQRQLAGPCREACTQQAAGGEGTEVPLTLFFLKRKKERTQDS